MQTPEVAFCREVDLVDEKILRNPYFIAEVESTKRSVYGWKNKEISDWLNWFQRIKKGLTELQNVLTLV